MGKKIKLPVKCCRKAKAPVDNPKDQPMASTLRHALEWLVTDDAQQALVYALVHDTDFRLLQALLKTSTGSDKERDPSLLSAILRVFGPYEDQLLRLVSSLVLQEMTETLDWSNLFRANSFTTALIREYTNDQGSEFLRSALQQVIHEISDSDASFEVNPVHLQPQDDLEQNQLRLRALAQRILDDVFDAAQTFPSPIAKVYNNLETQMNKVLDRTQTGLPSFSESEPCPFVDQWDPARDSEMRPKTEFISHLGGFVFLRFICPALIMPQKAGLVPTDTKPAKNIQRALILVAKIFQNLANNTECGWKESYMEPFDEFLTSNRPKLIEFYEQIGAFSGVERRRSSSLQISTLVPRASQLWSSSDICVRQSDSSSGPTAMALETLRSFILDHAETIETMLAMDVSAGGRSSVIEAYQRASIHQKQLHKSYRGPCDGVLQTSKQQKSIQAESRFVSITRPDPVMTVNLDENIQDEISDLVSHQHLQLIKLYYSKLSQDGLQDLLMVNDCPRWVHVKTKDGTEIFRRKRARSTPRHGKLVEMKSTVFVRASADSVFNHFKSCDAVVGCDGRDGCLAQINNLDESRSLVYRSQKKLSLWPKWLVKPRDSCDLLCFIEKTGSVGTRAVLMESIPRPETPRSGGVVRMSYASGGFIISPAQMIQDNVRVNGCMLTFIVRADWKGSLPRALAERMCYRQVLSVQRMKNRIEAHENQV